MRARTHLAGFPGGSEEGPAEAASVDLTLTTRSPEELRQKAAEGHSEAVVELGRRGAAEGVEAA